MSWLDGTTRRVSVVDSHTGGEPTRVVLSGGPELGGGDLARRLERLRSEYDDFRSAVVNEPRGSDVLVGALLCAPLKADSVAAVIFFNNVGYLGMCGHGTIGVVATLAHQGTLAAGSHLIETPVGDVTAELHDDGSVSVHNVPAYRLLTKVSVSFVDGFGKRVAVSGDVAWGGNWFFLCSDHGQDLEDPDLKALTDYSSRLRNALAAAGISGADGAEIDHVELFAASSVADSRSFVLCPGDAYDRSPCGTGTSAKLACLAADGLLAAGVTWRQESIIGSVFEARYSIGNRIDNRAGNSVGNDVGERREILPVITGRAHVVAESTLLFAADDPFKSGIATSGLVPGVKALPSRTRAPLATKTGDRS